ncbi:hypothetical protein [Spirochaeta africana]|uniref:Uncharacterized protein n=1 Tax=Spirochaeta africana (strain ATCC 700263 / DSM 8902 / Z-7692) TaxID=889378 RepID=H9UG97_SPIAZ|nr:hypothetical protein [Spirochaeta africana]AFG36540.1 hypothetical protein Spiaf_0436 [Spirochaeta africana DSM 8902]
MADLSTAPVTLQSAVRECDSHMQRLDRSSELLAGFFPLTRTALEQADDQQIEHIDQFIYRFMKLQDSLGTRLLPSLYAILEQSTQPRPFLDILNRLEQLEVIPSAADWQFFRNLRNNLAHDYPESIDQTVLTLNTLHSHWPRLREFYQQARAAAVRVR